MRTALYDIAVALAIAAAIAALALTLINTDNHLRRWDTHAAITEEAGK